jgi:hypothetical protein
MLYYLYNRKNGQQFLNKIFRKKEHMIKIHSNCYSSNLRNYNYSVFITIFLVIVMGFELKALYLVTKLSNTWATPPGSNIYNFANIWLCYYHNLKQMHLSKTNELQLWDKLTNVDCVPSSDSFFKVKESCSLDSRIGFDISYHKVSMWNILRLRQRNQTWYTEGV